MSRRAPSLNVRRWRLIISVSLASLTPQTLRGSPGSSAELVALDLASLSSVADAATDVAGRTDALDLLVNNAGIMAVGEGRTADGFELQLGTNHLGHFALTGRLLPLLLKGSGPRVVTVSSYAHKIGTIRFDDLMGEHGYRRWRAYGQSKLANLLFALELDRRAHGRLTSVAAHPGYAATHLQQGQGQKRFEQLKTVHEIAPVFLKNEARIEALFTVYFLALMVQALIERGVIGDFRAGEPSAARDGDADTSLGADLLRFGFTPLYTRYVDAWDAAEHLHDVLKGGAWRDDRFARRGKVT